MKQSFTIQASLRSDLGKGASRRLRRTDSVPGIVYGAGKEPTAILVDHNALSRLLVNEAFYTNILALEIDGQQEQVILRDLQRHPYKPVIMHLDLQRISDRDPIVMRVPLHFVGVEVAPGVKVSGGTVARLLSDIELRGLPQNFPEFIQVDLSQLELNQSVHLSNLPLPEGVEIVALLHGEDRPVVTINAPRTAVDLDNATPAASEVPVASKGSAE